MAALIVRPAQRDHQELWDDPDQEDWQESREWAVIRVGTVNLVIQENKVRLDRSDQSENQEHQARKEPTLRIQSDDLDQR